MFKIHRYGMIKKKQEYPEYKRRVMKENEVILKRQSTRIFFKNGDTDFFFNWLLGIGEVFGFSHGELYYLAQELGKSPKPDNWKSVFLSHGNYLEQKVSHSGLSEQTKAQYYLAQTYSLRSAIQFINPFSDEYLPTVHKMETAFSNAIQSLGAPVEELSIPYQDSYLPGYYLHSGNHCPTLIMIGGGDTYREDLFYFAGYPGWMRSYNVLMVDLPGQGSNPGRGLTFDVNASIPISQCIDWLEGRNPQLNHLAIYGVSGGGYFTAQAVEEDTRIHAWIASTPIYDVSEIFRKEFGAGLKTPSWLMNVLLKLAGSLNEAADLNLKKYAWQFGTSDFKSAINEVFNRAKVVDYQKIQCPCLFIMGEGEGAELQHQTRVIFEALKSKNSQTKLQIFEAESGADAHCQVNNLRLAHNVVFDWLDTLFEWNQKG